MFYYRIVLQKYLEAQVLWLVTKCEIKFYDMEPQSALRRRARTTREGEIQITR